MSVKMRGDDTRSSATVGALTTNALEVIVGSESSLTIQSDLPIWWAFEGTSGSALDVAKRVTAFGTGASTYVVPLPADGGAMSVFIQGKVGGELVELITVRGRA